MVKRNTPARPRQKGGASARSEAKKQSTKRFTLAKKTPFIKILQYYLLYASH